MVDKKEKYLLPELSVFFPCYNEGENIRNTIECALPIIKEISEKWEVIIVNDGSKDNTLIEAEKLAKTYGKNIRIINHEINKGYGGAFKSGLYGSRYKWIVFTDADGQFDFKDVYELIEKQRETGADLVIGYYLERKVPLYRIWGSKLWEFVVFILFGLKVRDTDCGFKLISRKVPDRIPRLEAERGPFINSEFLIQAKNSGFKVVETGVHHYPRLKGKATGTNFNVLVAAFKDLFRLWFKLRFKR